MKQALHRLAAAVMVIGIAMIAGHAQRRPKPQPTPTTKPAETGNSRDIFLQVTVTGFGDIVTIQPHDEGVDNGGSHDRVNFKHTATFRFENVPLAGPFGPIAEKTTARAVWSVSHEPYGNSEGQKCQTKPGELKDERRMTGVLEKTSVLTLKITPGFRSQPSSPPCIGGQPMPETFFIISIAPNLSMNSPGEVMMVLSNDVLKPPKKLVANGSLAGGDYELVYTIKPLSKYDKQYTVLAHADITVESDVDVPPVPPLMDKPDLL